MEIIIRGDYLIFVIGNLITDISIALFAFAIWYTQKSTSKVTLLLNNYLSSGIIEDVHLISILTAFEMVDCSLLHETYKTIKNNEKDKCVNKINSLFKKKKYFKNIQTLILFLFLIGIEIQVFALLIPNLYN